MKLIIIDDEQKICTLIKKLIDFEKLNIELIGMYNDGIKGLKAIKEHNPNIVITDIRMPGIDGISLIKEVDRLGLSTDFVIVSGHRQFEYAHTAIKYGVENYLLKPISKKELNTTLKNIIEKQKDIATNYGPHNDQDNILNKAFHDSNFFITNPLSNHDYKIVCVKTTLANNDIDKNLLKVVKDKIIALIQSNINGIADKMVYKFNGPYTYILFSLPKELLPKFDIFLGNFYFELNVFKSQFFNKLDFSVGVSQSNKTFSYDTILDTTRYSDEHLTNKEFKIHSKSNAVANYYCDLYEFSNIVNKAIIDNNYLTLENKIMEIKEENKNLPGFLILNLTKDLLVKFFARLAHFKSYDNSWVTDKMMILSYSDSTQKVFSTMLKIMKNEIISINRTDTNESNTYELAIQYLDKHFTDTSISLEEVASNINITSTYLSQLFSKHNELGFSQYITEKRVLLAKELLRKSNKKVKEISTDIGYFDSKYFTKLFKKHTGVKPSEYRKLYG